MVKEYDDGLATKETPVSNNQSRNTQTTPSTKIPARTPSKKVHDISIKAPVQTTSVPNKNTKKKNPKKKNDLKSMLKKRQEQDVDGSASGGYSFSDFLSTI